MNKVFMLIMGLLFTTRLYASIVPHVNELEHDAPILIRSALIVGVTGYLIWAVYKYIKKSKTSD
ncbi:hypothetical protein AB4343_03905 [Vibrio breoganii]|uniref:Uncharacterized protein n=1 Tax=Vibrio breoganii TaxID=553239 RepID=A0AAP8SVA4_9VIBR|nr:hypothetical protein [Vibrio breoganii]MDN3714816.1 hypothetical protein [Vibrio breoganii]OCH74487.1 hypothetical protein A6D95_13860 [Vibrio breoganii]OED93962.1 hypothetical protein A1QG_04200 [Vibrio breoganii ZF-29]OEF83081.1 hypothetical protein B003_09095 [Vibrio breoganii 1C10]PMG00721.1 hypothetical protein BCV02_02275 [Vibrio breoganii]